MLSWCAPAPLPLYQNLNSPVPGCTYSGDIDYDMTAATNIGGVFPFKSSDSLACRAWKLAATICNSAPSEYSSSTGSTGANSYNFQCLSSGGFTDPRFGTFCSVGSQFICAPPRAAVAAFALVGFAMVVPNAVALREPGLNSVCRYRVSRIMQCGHLQLWNWGNYLVFAQLRWV